MTESPQILIIEDEPDIIELMKFHLQREGYTVGHTCDTQDIQTKVQTMQPQLIILDLMLPGVNGYDICKQLKQNPLTQPIPILIVSAKVEEADIVTGLELGADDYLNKPFSPRVLVARTRALLRRQASNPVTEAPTPTAPKSLHELSIDPQAHEVRYKGAPISLTTSEFKALSCLAENPGWVMSRYQIVEAIRGENYIVTDRTVDVLIVGLRKKLGDAGHLIETVRGVGYRLKSL